MIQFPALTPREQLELDPWDWLSLSIVTERQTDEAVGVAGG